MKEVGCEGKDGTWGLYVSVTPCISAALFQIEVASFLSNLNVKSRTME